MKQIIAFAILLLSLTSCKKEGRDKTMQPSDLPITGLAQTTPSALDCPYQTGMPGGQALYGGTEGGDNLQIFATHAGNQGLIRMMSNVVIEASYFNPNPTLYFKWRNPGAARITQVDNVLEVRLNENGSVLGYIKARLRTPPLPEYKDNAEAITAGMVMGDQYRYGDNVKTVH